MDDGEEGGGGGGTSSPGRGADDGDVRWTMDRRTSVPHSRATTMGTPASA